MENVFTRLRTALATVAMVLTCLQSQASADPVIHTTTKAYGFSISNKPFGIFSFDLKKPGTPAMLYQQDYTASAGAFARGKYYAMLADADGKAIGLFSFDLKTGEKKQLNDMSAAPSIFTDMTYDYTTSTMYAIADDYPATAFLKVDLETGNHTLIQNIDNKILWTLAADSQGKLYSIGSDGALYTVHKETGELTELGYLDIYPRSLQSMDFDLNTDRLYWATMKYGTCQFYEINLNDFSLNPLGAFPDSYQVGGLFLAFTDAGSDAPDAVSGLKAEFDPQGSPKATINWTNPNTTFGGKPLNELSYAEVYRNDTLVGRVEPIRTGTKSQWTDPDAPNRTNTYKIIAYNNSGGGMPARATVFTGHDVPGAPSELTAELSGKNTITLSWQAPTQGLNKGWFDKSTLTYSILRKPDNANIATGLKETTFTDNSITTFAGYRYEVSSATNDGTGGTATSSLITTGDVISMPFSSPLDTEDNFDMWSNYDSDGNGTKWYWGKLTGKKNGAESRADLHSADNNWLISPPLSLETGKVYELSLTVNTAAYEADSLRITLGRENTPDAQNLVVLERNIKNYYGEKIIVMLPALDESGTYYLGLNHCSPVAKGMVVHVNDLLLKEQDKGSVNGTVTDGTKPLAGVTVTLGDPTFTTLTDAQGNYTIADVTAGKYSLKGVLLGYEDGTEEITVEPLKETKADLKLDARPVYRFTGKVTDEANKPVGGASVMLSGYHSYRTTSNLSGEFTIPEIYRSDDYEVTVRKNNFEPVSFPQEMSEELDKTVQLRYKPVAPYELSTTDNGTNVGLQWTRPVDLNNYQYDNGNTESYLGYDEGGEYHVVGSIYPDATTLYRVKWFTMPNENKKPYVHLYIFDLDENGNPTSKALFMQKNIPTVDYEWTTFELPAPVEAPRGFLLALSSDGNVSLGIDSGDPDGIIRHPHTQCFNTNYEFPQGYRFLDETNKTYHLMIRAEGEPIEDKSVSTPLELKYDLWRLSAEDTDKPEKWTSLQSGLTATTFSDTEIAKLPQGIYRYAVKAIYPVGNLVSEPTFSPDVNYKMYTRLILNVSANSVPEDANGTKALLTDKQGHEYTATVSGNRATFEKVWKGIYYLTLEQPGFESRSNIKLSIDKESEYTFDYTLIQRLDKPSNLDILPTDQAWNWKLIWNAEPNIEDGFEDPEAYSDFEINPAGKTGWQYNDADGLPTYGFASTVFPGMRNPMAAIVFDPQKTEPVLNTPVFEGKRMLAFFCATEASSDDYLISPRLDFYKDFTFSFHAKTYDADYGLERIRVGYSLTDTELENFTWLDEELVEVPAEFTAYNYTIPKEARYVALNSQSLNGFILFVDDVFIGVNRPANQPSDAPGSVQKYKVYLDNHLVAETGETSYLLTNLGKGDHQAGVSQVFATGESEPLNVRFTVTEGNGIDNMDSSALSVFLTPENHLIIRGAYIDAIVFDAAGNEAVRGRTENFTDLSGLPDGVYVVRVTDTAGRLSYFKVVKK